MVAQVFDIKQMLAKSFGLVLLICWSFCLSGQSGIKNHYQGYEESLSGKRFGYHSPLPEVNTSLLLRGRQDYKSLEWKSEVLDDKDQGDFVNFIWAFGMDVTSSPANFHLSVNDQELFSFSNSQIPENLVRRHEREDGAELILRTTLLDKYQDHMGFALLKLPQSLVNKGEAQVFKVSTSSRDNEAWYMTFTSPVEESIKIYQNQVIAKKDGELFYSISVDMIHTGEESEVLIEIAKIKSTYQLTPGFNKVEVLIPRDDTKKHYDAKIKIGDGPKVKKHFHLEEVRQWEIFLVQHTHTDIGYTRPQTEILPEHLRYIDQALDYCDYTDDYPDAAKFRWTCETSWSVREYLKSRPQKQIDRLLNRIREGRIEATGMFLNYSEIVDEAALAAQTKTLRFLKNKGIDVTTAMQNDVNGIAWCLVDYYHNTDVKYLNMGIHAHRARKPFNKPTSFWWQSPAGKRLLAYRSEHYQHGNSLGINTGQQDQLMNNLSLYLRGLEEKGYPYDKIALQFSGYVTDNSPPSTAACDIIREWNEKYEWPKLRSSLARDFLIYLDEQHSDDLETKEVAWPDWWTDGVASAANETKEVRKAQANMNAVSSLFSMARILGTDLPGEINQEIEEVYDNILFYTEHTHGAAESVSDPYAQNTINQWGMKAAYAWEAAKGAKALEEKALAYLEGSFERSNLPGIVVFNTLNWKRSGMVELFITNGIIPEGRQFSILDEDNSRVPWQRNEQRMEGAYFSLWVNDIPPMGYKRLKVLLDEKAQSEKRKNNNSLENDFYRISVDTEKGIITELFDKELNRDLIDPTDTLSMGQFIYEEMDNRHEMERLTNLTRDTVYRPLKLTRSLLKEVRVIRKDNGPIYQSLFLNGKMPRCADERGVDIEIRLYKQQKKIELLYKMVKLPVFSPEAVYVAFPFHLEGGKLAFEAQGGVVYPGINQLEGSSSDWNTHQNFAAVKSKDAQIVMVSPEIPLLQFGAINTGRYYYRLKPETNHMFSWVLNNYWVTNFKASQEGELRWKYSITSSADPSDFFATRFGWGERIPFATRILFPQMKDTKAEIPSGKLLSIDVPNLLLVNSTLSADGKGIVLHLREIEGGHATLDIGRLMEETKAEKITEVNILEEELKVLNKTLLFEHYETKFIKLDFKD